MKHNYDYDRNEKQQKNRGQKTKQPLTKRQPGVN